MFANAQAYEILMGRWSVLVASQLVDFADLHGAGRFLDVGSGTGSLAWTIAERNPRALVQGIDPSKEYVEYARGRNAFPDRVKFEVGDAQNLPFADTGFDATASLLAFNFIPDPKQALVEICRVTKAGGGISAAVWDYGQGMQMLRLFWDSVASVDPAAASSHEMYMPLCREGALEALWRACGLVDVTGRPLDIEMKFESFADYWGPFLLGQGPAGVYVQRIDDAHREVLREEVKRRLGLHEENRPFSLQARAWAARGFVPTRH
jgi:SAM-dependent methyltransferase